MAGTQEFLEAAGDVKKLSTEPSQAEALELYALFQQATIGDVNTPRPGMFDYKGKAKWDAWNYVKGKPREAAELEYIQLVKRLKISYGMK